MGDPCVFLRAGELCAIVGDDTERGAGTSQYSGLWSLLHTACQVSPFQNSMAGVISSAHRGTHPVLECIDSSSARLVRTPCEAMPYATSTGIYRLREPHYVDYEFTLDFTEDAQEIPESIECVWASYMNSPADSSIYFLEEGRWVRLTPHIHGMNATVLPKGLAVSDRQDWEKREGEECHRLQENFWESLSGRSFDYPFFFGQLHGMVMLLMADCHEDFRIFLSPSGANYSCIPGGQSPAWDFSWIVRGAQPGQRRSLNVRLAWFQGRRWDTAKQVWQEWEKFREIYPTRQRS